MSDFLALLISQQNERERGVALERRRLQREAIATIMPAQRTPGRLRRLWARTNRRATPVGHIVRPS